MMVRIVLNHALRKMPPLDGGLGTVKWIQNIRPCRPQSRPTEKIVPSDTLNRRIPDLISLTWPRQPQAVSLSPR